MTYIAHRTDAIRYVVRDRYQTFTDNYFAEDSIKELLIKQASSLFSMTEGETESDFSIKNHLYSSLAQSVERRTVKLYAIGPMV